MCICHAALTTSKRYFGDPGRKRPVNPVKLVPVCSGLTIDARPGTVGISKEDA